MILSRGRLILRKCLPDVMNRLLAEGASVDDFSDEDNFVFLFVYPSVDKRNYICMREIL